MNSMKSHSSLKRRRALVALRSLLGAATIPLSSQAAHLTASDGAADDFFGASVSQSAGVGLIGAEGANPGGNDNQGVAYIYRNLDTTSATALTQRVTLTASDGAAEDRFGGSVSLSGGLGLIGASIATFDGDEVGQGSAYVYRNLDTTPATVLTQSVKLTAGDGATGDQFGSSVSLSGGLGLVGAVQFSSSVSNYGPGAAYVYRSLDSTPATALTQSVKLIASDGRAADRFGFSVSLSGGLGLVGAIQWGISSNEGNGAAYVYRNLDTTSATVMTQSVKLTASDGAVGDFFGRSVSLSGEMGLVGASGANAGANFDQGAAYVYRNLNSTSATALSQNVKLVASDGADGDSFGVSVSLSGGVGLVGANLDDLGPSSNVGSAYIFRNLDTTSAAVLTQSVKITPSDDVSSNDFGGSVSLSGDRFTIGSSYGNSSRGKAYSGSLSSITTMDIGNTSKVISGISFDSQEDWIIGQTSSGNQVTLGSGDSASVIAAGKSVTIGKSAGATNNTLVTRGVVRANTLVVGDAGDGTLSIEGGSVTVNGGIGTLTVAKTSNSIGVVNIGTGSAAGTVLAGEINGASGTATVNFNHTGSLTFAPRLTGSLAVNKFAFGTTRLTGANSYTRSTVVSAGTLEIAGSLSGGTPILLTSGSKLLLDGPSESISNGSTLTLDSSTLAFKNGLIGTKETFAILNLVGNAVLDFGDGNSNQFSFLNGITGLQDFTLRIDNWSGPAGVGTQDVLSMSNALDATELSRISFYSGSGTGFLGTGSQIAFGGPAFEVVPVPEPSSTALVSMVGLFGILRYRKHRRPFALS
jgi:autotransporter-associated beta strand protein